jgi:hypothetical protein
MSNQPLHKPYEWAEKMFQNAPDVAPKYRDMLAMLACSLMGNEGAAQHFYAKAVIDGASDAELKRVSETAKIAKMDIGDLTTNVQRAVEEIRAEQEQSADDKDDSQVNLN